MSWIQENRFAAGLGGVTAVAAVGLIFWGFSERSTYSKAQADYETSSGKITEMEGSRLYPNEVNLRGKKTALAEYFNGVEKLQKAFDAYRKTELPLVEPSIFTEDLKKVKGEIDKALSDSKVETPPQFYMGFETYTQTTVQKNAT
ncbi:MAG: hypothetical protein JWO82_2118, partial [Akkermansiaceae bacterium]|nr:hypothetical protein [Akkermansiaceae bacterium]